MPKETKEKNNKVKKTTKPNTKGKTSQKNVVKKETKPLEVKTEKVERVVEKETVKEGNILIDRITNNTPFAISLCVIVLLVALLIFVGCYKRVPKTSDGKEVLATMKGKRITADELYEKLKEENGTDALISIVDDYIASKEVTITDDDKNYVNEVVDYYKSYAEYYGVDLETFLANYVGLPGVTTEEEFYNYVLEDYKKTLAVVKYIGDNASEEELKNYYKENYTEKLTVKHILIEVDADAEDQTKADEEALNKAKELIKELDGTDSNNLDSKFNELAENNSDDTATYSNGGLYENFSKTDVVEEFWNASYALKDGEYTKEPVKTSYGYHIILRVSSTPADKYEDIVDEVKKAYAQNLLSNDTTLITKKWDELRKLYKLSIKDDVIKKAYEKSIKDSTGEIEDESEEE